MDIAALKAELLANHPVAGPYDADNAVAADQLNAVNRTRNTKTAEYKWPVWDILHLGELNPFGVKADLWT
jgi:hypothetical protein